jgi:hypothetical protein
MKTKKSTSTKRKQSSSASYSQEKNTDLNPENFYIHDVMDNINKVVDFYTQSFNRFLDIGSKLTIASQKIQEECLEYGNEAVACNSDTAKQLSTCKDLPETVSAHSDFVQNHMNNNKKHLERLSESSARLCDEITNDILRNIEEINTKIKESCNLSRVKP